MKRILITYSQFVCIFIAAFLVCYFSFPVLVGNATEWTVRYINPFTND